VIRIATGLLDEIRRAVRDGYPEEVCGVLLGPIGAGTDRSIVRVVAVANAREAERARRYLIPADRLREIESSASREGLDVVGFYHSHPDHPAVPSSYDRDHSWPWYTYLIVSVSAANGTQARAWRLADDRSTLQEEEILEEHS
jgi:proteasome lid subunit RPN8/RPN11